MSHPTAAKKGVIDGISPTQYCTQGVPRTSLVVEMVDMLVKKATVQQTVRPIEPCVVEVVKQHDCQQDVEDLRSQKLVSAMCTS